MYCGHIEHTNMSWRYYFVNYNVVFTGNKLAGNPRIVKINPSHFWSKGAPLPSPSYETLEELKQLDKGYRNFKKIRPSTAKLIASPEHIQEMHDVMIGSKYDDAQMGNMLKHLMEGTMKSKEFSGIHYLPTPHPDFITNYKEIAPPNHVGVYTASFEIRKGKKILIKKDNSTIFPKDWSRQRVYDECLFALNNRIKVGVNQESIAYKSSTKSGIPVEIYFNLAETRINTLYPIRE